MAVGELDEIGGLGPARGTPAGEEVEHHPAASQTSQRRDAAGEIATLHRGRRLADQEARSRLGGRRAARQHGDEHERAEADPTGGPPRELRLGAVAPHELAPAPTGAWAGSAPLRARAPDSSGAATVRRPGHLAGARHGGVLRAPPAAAGTAASTAPKAVMAPPTQSHNTMGWMTTSIVAGPWGERSMSATVR